MLPKIQQPLFEMTIPSTSQKVTFRPFTVREEKLLLMAQQGNNDAEMIRAISQVVNNCVQDDSFNVKRLATFDLEYMFLKIRAKSVNNIIEVSYRDREDDKVYEFKVDIDDLEVEMPKAVKDTIKLSDDTGIKLKYPSADIIDKATEFEDNIEMLTFFIIQCIDSIYQREDLYNAIDYTYDELQDFVEQLPSKAFEEMNDFFTEIPKLHYEIKYINEQGNDRVIVMDNIKDFFPWG